MHGADVSGQIGTGSKGLRASLALDWSRMSFFMLPALNQLFLQSNRQRGMRQGARGKLTCAFDAL
jgi:hypothetical protein